MRMKLVLGLVMALFIGILLVLIVAARLAKPVMLDEHGRPHGALQVTSPHA